MKYPLREHGYAYGIGEGARVGAGAGATLFIWLVSAQQIAQEGVGLLGLLSTWWIGLIGAVVGGVFGLPIGGMVGTQVGRRRWERAARPIAALLTTLVVALTARLFVDAQPAEAWVDEVWRVAPLPLGASALWGWHGGARYEARLTHAARRFDRPGGTFPDPTPAHQRVPITPSGEAHAPTADERTESRNPLSPDLPLELVKSSAAIDPWFDGLRGAFGDTDNDSDSGNGAPAMPYAKAPARRRGTQELD